jgi:hypothetical protein
MFFRRELLAVLCLSLLCSSCGENDSPAAPVETAVQAEDVGISTAALPEIDPDELAALRALGYVEVGEALDAQVATGVQIHDRQRAMPGINLLTITRPCSAQLLDMEGTLLHSWSYSPCHTWSNAVLLPDGDLIVSGVDPVRSAEVSRDEFRFLMRLGWDNSLRWKRPITAHHDLDLMSNGQLLTIAYAPDSRHPELAGPTPFKNDSLKLLDKDGIELDEVTMWDLFESSPEVVSLMSVRPREENGRLEIDLFHLNSVEWMRHLELVGTNELYKTENLLVCIRNQDMVVVVNWPARKIIWSWGRGQLSAPHDATLQPNGNVLIFDNGMGRNWSRVVEVDPRTNEIVWEYRAPQPEDFYSETRGSSQRLSNGNTLITESQKGVAFEVTAEGEVVWRFQNPDLTAAREPRVVIRTRRFEGLGYDDLVQAIAAGDESRTRVD